MYVKYVYLIPNVKNIPRNKSISLFKNIYCHDVFEQKLFCKYKPKSFQEVDFLLDYLLIKTDHLLKRAI